ncbi:MAG: EAL domain-containing protein [Burkholderiales bacterium]|uniref:putative bifunctional diguanylate cyclase/phosphodiesterase n=1 Tax=Inhella sp. TaxID=1921806 RepID=UPI001AD5184E|nr:EAL domain-containing protein [Burkholderiales bacterium]
MNSLSRWWRAAWRVPGAHAADHDRHRALRLRDISQHMLVAAAGTLLLALLSQSLPWGEGRGQQIRWAWTAVLLADVLAHAWVWWRCGRAAPASTGSAVCLTVTVLNLTITGVAYGLMASYLMGVLDEALRLTMIGVAAAFLSAGAWLFAPHAACGLAWVLSFGLGLSLGIALTDVPGAALAAALALPYTAFLAVMVLMSARQRLAMLAQQDENERQRGMLDLLLRDFEAGANDWLFELDEMGRLRHVSQRLAQAAQQPARTLRGQALIEVLRGIGAEQLDSLALALRRARPFGDLLLPWGTEGERSWWSLKARPLFDEAGELCGWRGVTSDVTALRRHEAELMRLATRDTLTGLANRHLFYQQLGERLPQGCAVLLVDLDNFKQINDTLGHAAGDILLQELARRWQPLVPPSALLARLGGDEFGLLMPLDVDVDRLALTLQLALRYPLRVAERDLHIGISMGTACVPLDALDAERLLGRADVALYAAKAGGRSRLVHFQPELEQDAERRLHLSSDLREALHAPDGGLFTVYQPKHDLRSGRLVGFEALARWRHPRLGMVPPSEFIPLAEECGLVLELGERVLRQACADASQWPGPLLVAVNVSALQVERGSLLKLVTEALQDSDLAPQRLELELTESAFLGGSDKLPGLLAELRQLGVQVALDDFGTGYSSLAYLQSLPLDTLKIDRSFVIDLAAEDEAERPLGKRGAIVRTIIQLADAIGARTVAEGVETEAQRQCLIDLGCETGQGFLFSRPLAAREASVLANHPSPPALLPGAGPWAGLH